MLLSRYNKTDIMICREIPICHFLDNAASKLFALFLFFVRPLQSAHLEMKLGASASRDHRIYLFTKDGVRFPCERIRKIIPKWLVKVDIPFNFADWRQW